MSYDIEMVDKEGNVLQVAKHLEGGTCSAKIVDGKLVPDGTTDADLNVTYNYAKVYSACDFSIRDLDGKTGKQAREMLKIVILSLTATAGIEGLSLLPSENYWDATIGNALVPIQIMYGWTFIHPDGIFKAE